MEINIEERRVAIEAIATLVNVKGTMAELILKPARVPREIYRPLLYKRNESTGQQLSKREIAPLILEAVEKRTDGSSIIRAIIKNSGKLERFSSCSRRVQCSSNGSKGTRNLECN